MVAFTKVMPVTGWTAKPGWCVPLFPKRTVSDWA